MTCPLGGVTVARGDAVPFALRFSSARAAPRACGCAAVPNPKGVVVPDTGAVCALLGPALLGPPLIARLVGDGARDVDRDPGRDGPRDGARELAAVPLPLLDPCLNEKRLEDEPRLLRWNSCSGAGWPSSSA